MRFYCVGLAPDASEFSIRWFYGRKFNKKLSFHANYLELFFAFNAKLCGRNRCVRTQNDFRMPRKNIGKK